MEKRLKTPGEQKLHKFNRATPLVTCRVLNCKHELLEIIQDLSPFGQTKLSLSMPALTRSQPNQIKTQAKRHGTALTAKQKEKVPKSVDMISDLGFCNFSLSEFEQFPTKLSEFGFASSSKDNSERILGNDDHEIRLKKK